VSSLNRRAVNRLKRATFPTADGPRALGQKGRLAGNWNMCRPEDTGEFQTGPCRPRQTRPMVTQRVKVKRAVELYTEAIADAAQWRIPSVNLELMAWTNGVTKRVTAKRTGKSRCGRCQCAAPT